MVDFSSTNVVNHVKPIALPTQENTNSKIKYGYTSVTPVGCEPAVPVSERQERPDVQMHDSAVIHIIARMSVQRLIFSFYQLQFGVPLFLMIDALF